MKARTGSLSVVDNLGRTIKTRRRYRVESPAPIDAAPGSKFFFAGLRQPSLILQTGSATSVPIEVVRQADGAVVASWTFDAQPGEHTVRWDGQVGGASAPAGAYRFRLPGQASQATVSGETAFALYDHLFPIRGRHNLGYTRTNQFGGGRAHQGIDLFAPCGTRLAAARGGTVRYAGYHARAGNYVVIDGSATGTDYVYMHMQSAPLVRTGQRVFTGQKLGDVGDTGNASGCHLHYEMWSAPGWYRGGRAFDPLPSLRRWRGYG